VRAPARSRAVLLDTCAVIYLANGDLMAEPAVDAIIAAGLADGVYISPISAWEIGMLSRPGRPNTIRFLPDPKTWFARLLAVPTIRQAAFTPDIAIDSAHLPSPLHGDPADRLLIATARHLGMPIVTRDRQIAAYAAAGHIQVIGC
jgi:PIN domain nuclease of toxin-antitoxin system